MKVLVTATREQWMIACETERVIGAARSVAAAQRALHVALMVELRLERGVQVGREIRPEALERFRELENADRGQGVSPRARDLFGVDADALLAEIETLALPETLDFATAASLGCRFVTSFRAVVDQGKTSAGQWVAVHGCGGVGLSAIMIAHAVGANVVAIDISEDKLAMARAMGAVATVNATQVTNVVEAVMEITKGGAHVSLDALGHPTTCFNSISNLRRRGKHVQVGLMLAENSTPAIPMAKVIAHELEILGSHGMQAHRYGAMLDMVRTGKLAPEKLVGKKINLQQSIDALMNMDKFEVAGVTVITEF